MNEDEKIKRFVRFSDGKFGYACLQSLSDFITDCNDMKRIRIENNFIYYSFLEIDEIGSSCIRHNILFQYAIKNTLSNMKLILKYVKK